MIKLENLQRWIKSKGLIPQQESTIRNTEIHSQNEKNLHLGSNMDGSSGFHERRENGQIGSLSSFDNYGDEYNEKDDSQLNGS